MSVCVITAWIWSLKKTIKVRPLMIVAWFWRGKKAMIQKGPYFTRFFYQKSFKKF